MSIVKDPSLAPSGRQKIQWVRDFMPALSGIEERFRREKPFAGLTIAVSVHLEAKTANLGLVLREGGADVHLTGCNPLSTQDDVAAAMASLGVETFGVHGVDMRGYEDLLTETLKCRPHLIPAGGQVRPVWRPAHRRVRGDHHRHPPLGGPGEGGHPALPHDGGERRQGQALL